MHNKKFQLFLIQSIAFLSAFLLFQIELIIGKIFLPNFGGSYLVWGGCVVFFQAVLLLGYSYAHVVLSRFPLERYRFSHAVIMFIPFVFFPGHLLALKFPIAGLPMMVEVFLKLAITIGAVFFILSTMSIFWQAYLSSSDLPRKDNPYTLFAVSNLGSFLALLTYPFYMETQFDLYVQQNIWRVGYILLVILNIWAIVLVKIKPSAKTAAEKTEPISWHTIFAWLLYSAGSVMLFLAVTNILTSEIAPMPLLWVIPLAIYLLSFVLNFKQRPLCPQFMTRDFPGIAAFGCVLYFVVNGLVISKFWQAAMLLFYLFSVCMFCQNRVYHSRPHSRRLTFYYFIISLGGFFGGIFVSWIVPLISARPMEYFFATFCICLAFVIEHKAVKMKISFKQGAYILGVLILFFSSAWVSFRWKIFGVIIIAAGLIFLFQRLKKNPVGLLIAVLIPIILVDPLESQWVQRKYIYKDRNYYGIQKVFEHGGVRYLLHGTTIHGAQFQDPKMSFIPLMYYNPQSPAAKILIEEKNLRQVAMIGLGTGALTMYLKGPQTIDLFELDPKIYEIAQKYFTFLSRSPAQINTFFGDARLSLENRSDRLYDLIIVDAFSGDSVPIHLLTVQALKTYKDHLAEGGTIVFHVTNRYLDLPQALLKSAHAAGASVVYKHDLDYISKVFRSDWAALTWDPATLQKLVGEHGWKPLFESKNKKLKPLSDEYSSLLPYLKIDQLLSL